MSAFAAIEGRVRGMIARAVVRLIDDARACQEMQIDLLSDESQDGVERFQNYGFTSVPKNGAEALVACVGGLRSHAVALVVEDRRYRLKNLQSGEVAVFDDLGNMVKLGRDKIEIIAVSELAITAPQITVTGPVSIDGNVTVTGNVIADGISLKTHTHGGVTAGAASTGAPS